VSKLGYAWSWFKRYGWALLLIVLALAIWWFTRSRFPAVAIATELEVARARTDAAELLAETSHTVAVSVIEEQHRAALVKLDDEQRAQAVELRASPELLAEFLVRAARR
jgi:hypothetical protein